MQVFKFGGASVKDAEGVKNLAAILQSYGPTEKVVVISAMGKMTNALEEVIHAYFDRPDELTAKINFVKNFHLQICHSLFDDQHFVFETIQNHIQDLESFLAKNTSKNYDYVYDQVVSYGELLSTKIIHLFLQEEGLENTWLDARQLIQTDSVFRDAGVHWDKTQQQIQSLVDPKALSITQGFIAGNDQGNTLTLGREGSDYTAGIIAYCLDAEQVCIWKNVDGVMNGDPNEFENPVLLEHISYQEAIEFAFYGASVIHPKTLQPLQRKEIPLYVKSFYHPQARGTRVYKGLVTIPEVPCYIVKKDLILLSIATRDFSFFVERNVSEVFDLFHQYQVKVHLIQHSAISFSVCIDNKFRKADELIIHLQEKFEVTYNKNVSLYTIRHFDDEAIARIRNNRTVILEQRTRETVQMVTKT